jgi:tRNA-dihydrouridine synthase B
MMNIGSVKLENNVWLSPMEGVNCLAFRQVCKEYNAGLVATPMILVNRLFEEQQRQLDVVNFKKGEHPLQVQFGGSDTLMLKNATLLLDEYADIFDMNLGCPKSDILALKAGCFFNKHPEQLKKVIAPIINNTNKPVTAKIRIGWDDKCINTVQMVKVLEDLGVSAITVHGRTRQQKGSGKANWDEIRKAKEASSVPIIGNGDIKLPGHAKAMLERTGCDGVMIAGAAKGNPLIFRRTVHLLESGKNLPEPTDGERAKSFLRFSHYYAVQPRKSLPEFKQHALWFGGYFKPSKVLRARIMKEVDLEGITRLFEEF